MAVSGINLYFFSYDVFVAVLYHRGISFNFEP